MKTKTIFPPSISETATPFLLCEHSDIAEVSEGTAN